MRVITSTGMSVKDAAVPKFSTRVPEAFARVSNIDVSDARQVAASFKVSDSFSGWMPNRALTISV